MLFLSERRWAECARRGDGRKPRACCGGWVPNFNVDPNCRAAAQQAASPNCVSACRNTEQKARDELERRWPQLNAADKA